MSNQKPNMPDPNKRTEKYVPRHAASKKPKKAPGQTADVVEGFVNPETGELTFPERAKRRWPKVIAFAIIAILVAGVATFFFFQYQAHQRAELRREGYTLLDESIALIQESDALIVRMDAAVEGQVTAETLPQLQALLDQAPVAQTSLESAEEKALEAQSQFTESQDLEFAQYVLEASQHRQTMLEDGTGLIEADIAAMKSLGLFNEAWSAIVEADTAMRDAAERSSRGGATRIRESLELNRSANEKLTAALAKLEEAQTAFPSANFETVKTYIVLKQEAVNLAIQADEAYLANDPSTARTRNEEFAAKDEEVVAAAGQIPADPVSLLTDAYDVETTEMRTRYLETRSEVAEIDAFIRDYVGIDIQTGIQ